MELAVTIGYSWIYRIERYERTSGGNDRCPFVMGNLMLDISRQPGYTNCTITNSTCDMGDYFY